MDPTPELRFRAYAPGDADAMYELDVDCFAPPFRFPLESMREFAEADGAQVVLAEASGRLAGFCILQLERARSGWVGYLVTLDVAPGFRRRGLARELLRRVEVSAAQSGCGFVSLHVHSENAAAIRLYESLGFLRSGLAKSFYGRGRDALIYGKSISPHEATTPPPADAEAGQ